jgi:hypothetical protein
VLASVACEVAVVAGRSWSGRLACSARGRRLRCVGPVPVRPYKAAVDGALLELEDLTLLHRRSLPSHVASV